MWVNYHEIPRTNLSVHSVDGEGPTAGPNGHHLYHLMGVHLPLAPCGVGGPRNRAALFLEKADGPCPTPNDGVKHSIVWAFFCLGNRRKLFG